jgi:hypothetical protein
VASLLWFCLRGRGTKHILKELAYTYHTYSIHLIVFKAITKAMSAHTYNTIFNTGETYHCLTDFVQSTQSPSKHVYPFLYKADCQPGALEQRTAITYQEYGLPPSTAPSLSSSVSSPLSASSGDDEDIPHMIRTRISPAFSNDLVQRISLVDKLVGK